MRKILALSATLILLFAWVFSSDGEPVSSGVAAEIGKIHLEAEGRYWRGRTSALRRSARTGWDYSVSEVRELREQGRLLAYILDLEPEGCIVVSSDTDIYPVIAYSPEGRFSMIDTEENIFLHLVKWDMQNRLDALPSSSQSLKAANNASWERYLPGKGASTQAVVSSAEVWGPWLETTWSQGIAYRWPGYIYPDYDYGDYKRYCPTAHTSDWRCVTGCGPLAMAQVVNYWKYPSSLSFDQSDSYESSMSYSINGQSYSLTVDIDADHSTYDFPSFTELNSKLSYIRYYDGDLYFWDSQIWDYRSPVDEDPALSAAEKQEVKDDIAALCFACGIALQTRYSPVGSSASVSYYPDSTKDFSPLLDKFGYSSAIIADVDWPQFYTSLEANMKDAQPAMLLVDSQSGGQSHFIVADGYRDEWGGGSSGYYHLNFGWGDANPDDVDNSWYHLPEGMPQPDGYSQYDVVKLGVMDIYPPQQQNSPPVASNLSISPLFPKTGDDLVGSYDYSDPDGDPESGSQMRWYKDNVEQAAYYNLDTVSAADTSKGDVWHFTVTPGDGEDMGTLQTSPSVTIGNSPPAANNLSISPSFPATGDDLVGSYDYSDPDGDPESGSQIRWYKDSVEQAAYYGLDTVSAADTSEGDVWYFTVTPGDGTDYGETETSGSVTVEEQILHRDIQLYPGWNFISIYLDIADTDLLSVLDQIRDYCTSVWFYDVTAGKWKVYVFDGPQFANDLDTIEPGKGYWLKMADSAVLSITGERIADTAIQLLPGLNLVGYNLAEVKSREEAMSTIDGNYVALWTYDNNTGIWSRYIPNGAASLNTLAQMKPANAYYIEAIIGCVWTILP